MTTAGSAVHTREHACVSPRAVVITGQARMHWPPSGDGARRRRLSEACVQMFTVTTAPEDAQRMHERVMRLSPGAKRTYALGGTGKYEMVRSETPLSAVFAAMDAAEADGMAVSDWAVRSPSLEDVFIRIAREAEGQDEVADDAV